MAQARQELQEMAQKAIAQRDAARNECDEAYDQRDAWKEACVEVVKSRAPDMTKEELLAIYDEKKVQVKNGKK